MVDVPASTAADQGMENLGILCFIAFRREMRTIAPVSEARREMATVLRNMRRSSRPITRLFLKRVKAIDWGPFYG